MEVKGIKFTLVNDLEVSLADRPRSCTSFILEDRKTGKVKLLHNASFDKGLSAIVNGNVGKTFQTMYGMRAYRKLDIWYAIVPVVRISRYSLENELLGRWVDSVAEAKRIGVLLKSSTKQRKGVDRIPKRVVDTLTVPTIKW